jgi:heme exporter protein B
MSHQARPPIGFLRTTSVVVRKDLLLEWRGRARLNATVFFAGLTLLLFSFAVGPQHAMLSRLAPGFIWLSVMLASVLNLSESMRVEAENAAMEGLRLAPLDPRGIFLGKALVNAVFLWALGVVLVPLAVALYGAQITLGLPRLVLVLMLGTFAISAPGTLYAAIASQARSRDLLLPLLLFPILVPGLLAAVKATSLLFLGDPMAQLHGWLTLLLGFNIMYWVLAGLLFEKVIEQ